MRNTIKITGKIDFKIVSADGIIKDSWTVHNAIMNAGFAQLALLAGDATAVPFTYLAVGTSSTAVVATQTALQGEIVDSGLTRASATVSRVTTTVTNDTLKLYYEWTATGTKTVEEVGVFNAASGVTMLARALTTSKIIVATDKLQVSYNIKFS